jgi:hypothetical protein
MEFVLVLHSGIPICFGANFKLAHLFCCRIPLYLFVMLPRSSISSGVFFARWIQVLNFNIGYFICFTWPKLAIWVIIIFLRHCLYPLLFIFQSLFFQKLFWQFKLNFGRIVKGWFSTFVCDFRPIEKFDMANYAIWLTYCDFKLSSYEKWVLLNVNFTWYECLWYDTT